MRFVLYFLLISISSFGQNKDTYFAERLQQGIYQHLDTLGVRQEEDIFSCYCYFDAQADLSFFVGKQQSKSPDLDLDLLNWFDDDIIEYYTQQFNKKASDDLVGVSKRVSIDVNIKRILIRFNLFKFKWKVKYRIIVKYRYNPYNEKENRQ